MIKSIPGWLNFLILWLAYFSLTVVLNYAVNSLRQRLRFGRELREGSLGPVHITPQKKKWFELIDWTFCLLITAVYCGAYLAKWRFYDGGWHFF